MGRLYDKRDLAFNTDFWNKQEAQLSADIANGVLPASTLDIVLDERAACNCSTPCGKQHFKHVKIRDAFKLRRQQERMKLLRTGMLLSDLQHAKDNFNSCPHCHYERHGTRDWIVECDVHRPAYKKAKSNIYWAGVHNQEERQARGQIREDDPAPQPATVPTTADAQFLADVGIAPLDGPLVPEVGANPLNQWEEMYHRARAERVWPAEAAIYDTTPDYKGYLWVLRFEDEMTEGQYLAELQRLKDLEREIEASAPQWAGIDTTKQGTRKQKETFRRDTRFNSAG